MQPCEALRCKIGIQLEVSALIGIHPHEQHTPQPVTIDLEIELDLKRFFATYALEDTIDYDALQEICMEVCGTSHTHLLETLAKKLLDALEARFSMHSIKIRIEKSLRCAKAFVHMEKQYS